MELPKNVLEVGKRIIIGVPEGNAERQYISRIADVIGQTFSVAAPRLQQVPIHFKPGENITIYVSDTAAMYALKSTVIEELSNPVALVTLQVPIEVTRVQRREYVRIDVLFGPVDAFISSPENPERKSKVTATIVNLSAGGMRFTAREPVSPHLQVRTMIPLPSGFGVIPVTGLILRVDRKGDGFHAINEASVQFIDMSEKDRDRITQYIFRYQAELRKKGLG